MIPVLMGIEGRTVIPVLMEIEGHALSTASTKIAPENVAQSICLA